MRRALTSWGYTARLLVAAAVLFALIALAVWLLSVDVELGPLRVTRR